MRRVSKSLFALASFVTVPFAQACGGFFCQLTPINQAGEQIVFKQEGNETTTMVRIFYTGEATEFGWVLPVPDSPELSIGSDAVFNQLETLTRPQFNLTRTGESCDVALEVDETVTMTATSTDTAASVGGVIIEKRLDVGPFDAQIISSDDSSALATWLAENNLDLSERGAELLSPYIEAKMKFVVLKLQNERDAGDIQPLILKYQSEQPMIPIRLTAVAAQDDMGILVWVLGQNRAVPENFVHVTPNYTKLNWYTGPRNAYASYQTLITDAMNEAGGQGFATDYAGPFNDLSQLSSLANRASDIINSAPNQSSADTLVQTWVDFFASSITATITEELPLPEGQDNQVYSSALALQSQYSASELDRVSALILQELQDDILSPIENATNLFDNELYLTRLYTTLSADEMLTDPTFTFNADMPEQALERNATLDSSCNNDRTEWTLTLGEGTGRDGELVIDTRQNMPFSAQAPEQKSVWQVTKTSANQAPTLITKNEFEVIKLGDDTEENEQPNTEPNDNTGNDTGASSTSSSGGSLFWLSMLAFGVLKLRRRDKNKLN